MITVTEEAAELIRESKASQNIKDEVGVRITAMGESNFGPSYDIRFDLPSKTDQIFGEEGAQVFLAPPTMTIMDGATFGVADTPEGRAFKITNPNYVKEVSSGGCSSGGCGGCGSHSKSDDEGVSADSGCGGCGCH